MENAQTIHLQGGFENECFLIHGYTGSPRDFNKLPEYLHKYCQVDVKVILLKGHGTRIEDLDHLEIQDFLVQIEEEFKKDLNQYKRISLGGLSFGAQMALYLASHYPVEKVFSVGLPYRLKFPFNFPGIRAIGFFKKYWDKSRVTPIHLLNYPQPPYLQAHTKGLQIVNEANELLKVNLVKIKCPLFSIHSIRDRITDPKALELIEKKMGQSHQKRLFKEENHNIFLTESRFEVYRAIQKFIESPQKLQKERVKVAAIVPVYNEGTNVSNVLKALTQTDIIDEIIVIDDGSKDNTVEEVKKFKNIHLIQNQENKGKAYSMQRGVNHCNAEIIFFCDGDLKGLRPEIIAEVITPVIQGKYDMYIALRNHLAEKIISPLSFLSGERVITRELWNKVPNSFKHNYRIEIGLNSVAKYQGKGFGWKRFDYYHIRKEEKYGFWKGVIERMIENYDIMYAYFLATSTKKQIKNLNGF